MASNDPSWLPPQPIHFKTGHYLLEGDDEPIQETFEQIANAVHPPRHRLPRRSLEVRRALSLTLRYAHHPELIGRGPWLPNDPRYLPFRSTIAPLLSHNLWQSAQVLAAPYLAFIPRHRIAGAIDVVLQLPDGSTAIAILQCSRRNEAVLPAVRIELGGALAAICDHRSLFPSHAITIWAAAGNTELEYHHPDRCLGLWVDALDHIRFTAKTLAPIAS